MRKCRLHLGIELVLISAVSSKNDSCWPRDGNCPIRNWNKVLQCISFKTANSAFSCTHPASLETVCNSHGSHEIVSIAAWLLLAGMTTSFQTQSMRRGQSIAFICQHNLPLHHWRAVFLYFLTQQQLELDFKFSLFQQKIYSHSR